LQLAAGDVTTLLLVILQTNRKKAARLAEQNNYTYNRKYVQEKSGPFPVRIYDYMYNII